MKSLKEITRNLNPCSFDSIPKVGTVVIKTGEHFYHSGDLGDIIYALPAIRAMGGGTLFLGPTTLWQTRQKITPQTVEDLKTLLKLQPYLKDIVYTDTKPDDALDLNQFREYLMVEHGLMQSGRKRLNLAEAHLYIAKLPLDECNKPWLTVDKAEKVKDRPILFHRSSRWLNDDFPWQKVMDKLGKWAVFVGYKSEHEDFIKRFGFIPHAETPTFLSLAQLIAGCHVFVGNQSLPYAICEALKRPSLLEVWRDGPNCLFFRENACYGEGSIIYGPMVEKITDDRLPKCPICETGEESARLTINAETSIVKCQDCGAVYVRKRLNYDQIVNYRQFAGTVSGLLVENKLSPRSPLPPSPVGEVKRKSLWASEAHPCHKPMWLARRTEGHETVFYMSGDLGDIIYALPTIRVLGGGQLCVGPAKDSSYFWLREPMTRARFDVIEPLLALQKAYLSRVWFCETMNAYKCHVDLNDSRRLHREPYYLPERNLADTPSIYFQCGTGHWRMKWLEVPAKKVSRLVFSRSLRYPGKDFPWKRLVERYRTEAIFVGMPDEHKGFESQFGTIKYYPTKNLLDVATVIAGADWFVGNQSSPLAIAEGLKKNCVREHFDGSPNCIFDRDGHTADAACLLC